MRTGGEHEAGRSQVVVLSAPLRSVTKYCYGHLAHGDVALLPQPLLLGLGRGAQAEAEGPPARVLRGQRSRAAALSNTSLTLLPARLRHPSRSRSDSGYCQCQSREYQDTQARPDLDTGPWPGDVNTYCRTWWCSGSPCSGTPGTTARWGQNCWTPGHGHKCHIII